MLSHYEDNEIVWDDGRDGVINTLVLCLAHIAIIDIIL